MTHTFHELIIGGVLVAPIISYAVAALLVILVLRPLLDLIEFSAYFSNPSIAELSLYVTIFGLLTVLF